MGQSEQVEAAASAVPTLEDVAGLTSQSDFARFVAPSVQPDVRNAALRRLFSDPHFNVMDGLDVYIDDYTAADPLPPNLLRKLAQARFVGLPTDADEPPAPAAPAAQERGAPSEQAPAQEAQPGSSIAPHEDADLQLQPHDAAGCSGAAPHTRSDGGRQS